MTWRYDNPQWLELHMSRTKLHGPKDFRDIEVRLYVTTDLRTTKTYNRGTALERSKKKLLGT